MLPSFSTLVQGLESNTEQKGSQFVQPASYRYDASYASGHRPLQPFPAALSVGRKITPQIAFSSTDSSTDSIHSPPDKMGIKLGVGTYVSRAQFSFVFAAGFLRDFRSIPY